MYVSFLFILCLFLYLFIFFFFFNDTATTEIYTLSLHDALPIYVFCKLFNWRRLRTRRPKLGSTLILVVGYAIRSEERFSRNAETDLVCRLLLEKKKKKNKKSRDTHYYKCIQLIL